MSVDPVLEGGCLCGRVRYKLAGTPWNVGHCHCSMCRRASGAAVVTWLTVPDKGLSFTAGAPTWHQSSDHARRGFCAACGTQIAFASTRYPGEVDITAASLDHPELVTPTRHTYAPDRIPWLIMNDGLPRHVEGSDSPVIASSGDHNAI